MLYVQTYIRTYAPMLCTVCLLNALALHLSSIRTWFIQNVQSFLYSETSLNRTSDIRFPHLPQELPLEQICNNPVVHYAILFPHSICKFIRNGCVQISVV